MSALQSAEMANRLLLMRLPFRTQINPWNLTTHERLLTGNKYQESPSAFSVRTNTTQPLTAAGVAPSPGVQNKCLDDRRSELNYATQNRNSCFTDWLDINYQWVHCQLWTRSLTNLCEITDTEWAKIQSNTRLEMRANRLMIVVILFEHELVEVSSILSAGVLLVGKGGKWKRLEAEDMLSKGKKLWADTRLSPLTLIDATCRNQIRKFIRKILRGSVHDLFALFLLFVVDCQHNTFCDLDCDVLSLWFRPGHYYFCLPLVINHVYLAYQFISLRFRNRTNKFEIRF